MGHFLFQRLLHIQRLLRRPLEMFDDHPAVQRRRGWTDSSQALAHRRIQEPRVGPVRFDQGFHMVASRAAHVVFGATGLPRRMPRLPGPELT